MTFIFVSSSPPPAWRHIFGCPWSNVFHQMLACPSQVRPVAGAVRATAGASRCAAALSRCAAADVGVCNLSGLRSHCHNSSFVIFEFSKGVSAKFRDKTISAYMCQHRLTRSRCSISRRFSIHTPFAGRRQARCSSPRNRARPSTGSSRSRTQPGERSQSGIYDPGGWG